MNLQKQLGLISNFCHRRIYESCAGVSFLKKIKIINLYINIYRYINPFKITLEEVQFNEPFYIRRFHWHTATLFNYLEWHYIFEEILQKKISLFDEVPLKKKFILSRATEIRKRYYFRNLNNSSDLIYFWERKNKSS